jgi:hypothetical protein
MVEAAVLWNVRGPRHRAEELRVLEKRRDEQEASSSLKD